MVDAFEYPQTPHVRRNGPHGYTAYQSFRPWLRDEFCFRCVLCLHRELWPTTSEFEIDHLIPVSEHPDLECRYSNLLYVCRRCNNIKSDRRVPDPCSIAYGRCLRVNDDGSIVALNEEGRTLILTLRLDRPERIRQRRMVIEILLDAEVNGNTPRLRDWLGFPEDLEDLSRLRPPGNERPKGIEESFFARRRRGELPEMH